MRSLVVLGPDAATVARARTVGHPLLLVGPDPAAVAHLSHPYDEYLQADPCDAEELRAVCTEILRERDLVWLVADAGDPPLSTAQVQAWLGRDALPVEVVSASGPAAPVADRPTATAPPTPSRGS